MSESEQLCVGCRYSLQGLDDDAACPECGLTSEERLAFGRTNSSALPSCSGEAKPGEWRYIPSPDDTAKGQRLVLRLLGASVVLCLLGFVIPVIRWPAAILAAIPVLWLIAVTVPAMRRFAVNPFQCFIAYKKLGEARLCHPSKLIPLDGPPPVRDLKEAVPQEARLSPGQAERMSALNAEFESVGFREMGVCLHEGPQGGRVNAIVQLFGNPKNGGCALVIWVVLMIDAPAPVPAIGFAQLLRDGRQIAVVRKWNLSGMLRSLPGDKAYLFPMDTPIREMYDTHRELLRRVAPSFVPRCPSLAELEEFNFELDKRQYGHMIATRWLLPTEIPGEYRLSWRARIHASALYVPLVTPVARAFLYWRTRRLQRELGIREQGSI